MNPVLALREIGYLLERSRADTYRVRAYRGAADVVSQMSKRNAATIRSSAVGRRCPGLARRPQR